MKISKFLPVLFCFCAFFLKANTLPLPVVKHDFGVKTQATCLYRIRVNHRAGATLSVVVNGQTIVNNTYNGSGNDVNFITVNGQIRSVAIINATGCVIYISCLSSGAYYVLDFNPIVNTQLTLDPNDCSISDDL
jgi:hypothetical protein